MTRVLGGPYRVALCDIGETVVRHNPGFTATIAREATALGAEAELNNVRRVIDEEWHHAIADPANYGFTADVDQSKSFWLSLYSTIGARLGLGDSNEFVDRLYSHFTQFDSYAAMDGAHEALSQLRHAGIRVVAASNWEPWLLDLLVHLRMYDLFDHCVVSGIVGLEKPDPRFFLHALDVSGAAPIETVHMGDSFEADVQGAWTVSLDAIWVNTRGDMHRHECPTATTISEAVDMAINAGCRARDH